MSGHLPRTNRWLILLSVVLCLILRRNFHPFFCCDFTGQRSSDAGVFVSEDQDSSEFSSEGTVADNNDNFTDSSSGNCLDALLQIHLKLLRAVLH